MNLTITTCQFPIAVIVVICLAGFVQGLTGFGFGLVAMPLLAVWMDFKQTVAVVVLLNLVLTGMILFTTRAHFSWRNGLPLVIGACIGIPLGVYVLIEWNESLLRHALGGVMCLFAANELFFARTKAVRSLSRFGFPLGVASGGLDGAFNMGGPPAIAYVYSQPWSQQQMVALLQVVFGLGSVLRLTIFGGTGLLNREVVTLSAWALLPLGVCVLAATRLASRIPRDRLKQGVFIFVGVLGIKYLVFG